MVKFGTMKHRQKKIVRTLIEKARESSILAVNVYNNPSAVFRSGAFIVLMNIAWTSLFQAVFERDHIKYYYKDPGDKRRYIRIDGEPKSWDLSKCSKEYFKDDPNNPVYQNIQFFVGLRNKIEHSFIPRIDPDIFGECQSYLINFEEVLTKEFGINYALADSLIFALQYSRLRTDEQLLATRKIQSKSFNIVKKYIDDYRRNLDPVILADPRFAFRMFLIPKPANNQNTADAAIEFVKYDPNNPEEMQKYERIVTLIKEKNVSLALAIDTSEKAEKIIFVDRGKTDGLTVGVTSNPEKASGTLLIERLSKDVFNNPSNVIEATIMLDMKFVDSRRKMCFIYAHRNEVNSKQAIALLLERSYEEYIPFCHWLLNLDEITVVDFLKKKLDEKKWPKITSLFKLIFATNSKTWIDYIVSMAEPYGSYSQPPSWYWNFCKLIKAREDKDSIYHILEITHEQEIFGTKVEVLLQGDCLANQILSEACLNIAHNNDPDYSMLRKLDPIIYYRQLSEILSSVK